MPPRYETAVVHPQISGQSFGAQAQGSEQEKLVVESSEAFSSVSSTVVENE